MTGGLPSLLGQSSGGTPSYPLGGPTGSAAGVSAVPVGS